MSLRDLGLTGADRKLRAIAYDWERCDVAFQQLDWSAMRRHALRGAELFAKLASAGLEPVRLNELAVAIGHNLLRASVEMGLHGEALSELERMRHHDAGLTADADIQHRFDFVGRQLTGIQVLRGIDRLEVARATLRSIWPNVEEVFAAGPHYHFNQVQMARALSLRAAIDGTAEERRGWLGRAADYLRPAVAAGKLTRHEREVLLAGIENQLAILGDGEKP